MSSTEFCFYGLDHVQLAMPAGGDDVARAFYAGFLGLKEQPKPLNLSKRGGVWFSQGALRLHMGVEEDFRPARNAYPAFLVTNLTGVLERCSRAGVPVVEDEPLEGYRRFMLRIRLGIALS